MNKGVWLGGGLGLLSLLGGLAIIGQETKEQAETIDPAMEAGFKGANTANVVNMNMARTLYMQAKGKPPEKIEDLVPEFLSQVPSEAFSKSKAVVSAYDGTGGWVMDDSGFRPNHPQILEVAKK